MTKFAVALDGSDHAKKAFDVAMKVSRGADDELVLVTVTKKPDDAKQSLQAYQEEAEKAGRNVKTAVLTGKDARDALCTFVEGEGVDVLIVGTRGLGTIKRMFLGSVSSHCVQYAQCDVIVAK